MKRGYCVTLFCSLVSTVDDPTNFCQLKKKERKTSQLCLNALNTAASVIPHADVQNAAVMWHTGGGATSLSRPVRTQRRSRSQQLHGRKKKNREETNNGTLQYLWSRCPHSTALHPHLHLWWAWRSVLADGGGERVWGLKETSGPPLSA